MKYRIGGAKVGLVELSRREATQTYVDWMNDQDVTRYLVSGESTMADIETFIDEAQRTDRVTFAIYRRDEDRHIGNVKLDNIDPARRECDIGLLIGDKSSWGRGFATEATRLATSYAFDTLGLDRVYLGVVAGNVAAIRVYERLGFVREGRRRREQLVGGEWADAIQMATTRTRFASIHDRVVAIIQARMSSRRMPGKVLAPLAGRSALARLVERARLVARIDDVAVATSVDPSDDPVVAETEALGVRVVRGPLDDVLARTVAAADETKADVVMRITADCPMHDPRVITRCLDVWAGRDDDVDYVWNAEVRTYPDGLDVEIFSRAALDEAQICASTAYEREHVTVWIREHKKRRDFVQENDLSALCWTLDHPEDHAFLSSVFDALQTGDRVFGADDVYRWLLDHPDRVWTGVRHPLSTVERDELLRRIDAQLRADSVRA